MGISKRRKKKLIVGKLYKLLLIGHAKNYSSLRNEPRQKRQTNSRST